MPFLKRVIELLSTPQVSRRGGADGSGGGHLSVSLESMESGETAPSNPLDHRNGGSLSPGGGFRSGGSYDDHDDKQNKRDLPLRMLALRVSPAAFAIFLSVGSSMLVFPFFTYVHSTGLLGERLPQVGRKHGMGQSEWDRPGIL